MIIIKTKFKRLGALFMALMLSLSLCCTTAFAAPATAPSDGEGDAQVEVVSGSAVEEETEQDSNPFGKSYIIKGVAVVGAGLAFYVILSIKSRKKK